MKSSTLVGAAMLTFTTTALAQPCVTCWYEVGDAGDLPATRQVPVIPLGVGTIFGQLQSPSDVDMYELSICINEAEFRAVATGDMDARLYLFSRDGLALVQCVGPGVGSATEMDGQYLLAPGRYLLAITGPATMARTAADEPMFSESAGPGESGPTQAGSQSPVDHWHVGGADGHGLYTISLLGACPIAACGTADFNNDGDSATDLDIEDFFRCISGDCCSDCGSADFNADGDVATDADIEAFFRVLAGGSC
jgi:hypothetical protein